MRTFLTLVKTQLNVNFGFSALKYRFTKEKRRRWEPILIGSAIVFGFGPLLALYTLLVTGMFAAGTALGQPEMVIKLTFLFSQLMILFFGLFYIMGVFYFSQDMETLVPLPLKPYEVLAGKFTIVLADEYLTALPLLIPPFIVYGIGTGQGLGYLVKCIFVLLAAPVIPLAVGSVFMILLMRFVNLRRNKDLLAIIGGFAGLLLALLVNVFIQRAARIQSTDFIKDMLASQSELIRQFGQKYPPCIWVTRGLSDNGLAGLGYFLLFLLVAAALLGFLLWLSNLVFYKGLIAGQEVSRKKKALTQEEAAKQYGRVSNPVMAVLRREWKLLLRTPLYVINGLTGAVIGPIIILIMFVAQGSSPETKQLMDMLANPAAALYVSLGGLGVMLFTAGVNVVASTSVSREGRYFWIAKMIPVTPRQQVLGKFLQGYMVSALGVLVTGLVLGIFLGFSAPRVLGIMIVGLLAAISMVALNLQLDVAHPKLVWGSEQEAMKQNMNSMLGMLISLLIMAVYAVIAVVLIILQLPAWVVFSGIGLVGIVIAIPSVVLLLATADKIYARLEA